MKKGILLVCLVITFALCAFSQDSVSGGGSLAGGGSLTAPPSHSVSLSWTASTSTGILGYNVYRSLTSGGPYSKLNSTPVSGTTYLDSSVIAGQTYYYVATAVGQGNVESAYSNQAAATIPSP
ncbi:MAG TPA: hypothetical protein VMX16_11545 [Terriglobia bacterium]|nr:hypothetical protein [Terriglobia bacterium]